MAKSVSRIEIPLPMQTASATSCAWAWALNFTQDRKCRFASALEDWLALLLWLPLTLLHDFIRKDRRCTGQTASYWLHLIAPLQHILPAAVFISLANSTATMTAHVVGASCMMTHAAHYRATLPSCHARQVPAARLGVAHSQITGSRLGSKSFAGEHTG